MLNINEGVVVMIDMPLESKNNLFFFYYGNKVVDDESGPYRENL